MHADHFAQVDPSADVDPGGSSDPRGHRSCARVGCAEPAAHTLTADYADRVMAVGPLSPERTPPSLDLCVRHCGALTPPEGWELLRHNAHRSLPDAVA